MISVIIPVYNIAPHIKACVQSVLRQTYKNYEILLVDDGSTDESGQICDALEKENACIRVIHKQNGGLSSARNAGIKLAKGEYIVFVDGDDYVHALYLEKLLTVCEKYQADIACCGYLQLTSQSSFTITEKEEEQVFSFHEALAHREQVHQMAWNKLYKKRIFANTLFTEGILHEDIDSYYRFLQQAERIAYCSLPLYGYVQRSGSICHVRNKKSYKDWYHALRREITFFENQKDAVGKYYAVEEFSEFMAMFFFQCGFSIGQKPIQNAIHKKFKQVLQQNKDVKLPVRYKLFKARPILFFLYMMVKEPKWYRNVVLQAASQPEKKSKAYKLRDAFCQKLFPIVYRRKMHLQDIKNPARDLYFCDTPYHLLITIIKAMQSGKRPALLLSDKNMDTKRLVPLLEELHLFSEILCIHEREEDLMHYMEYCKRFFVIRRKLKKQYMESKFPVLACLKKYRIHMFCEVCIVGYYLEVIEKPFHLLEDGRDAFSLRGEVLSIENRTRESEAVDYIWHSRSLSMGQSPLIRSIEMHRKAAEFRWIKQCPIRVKNKDKMLKCVTRSQWEKLIHIFGAEELIALEKELKATDFTILLTQPLYQIQYVPSYEKQLEVYKRMAEEYAEGKLVIKVHPRDKASYETIFPQARILKSSYPAELWQGIALEPTRILCGFSTTAGIFSEEIKRVYFTPEEFREKYLQ